MERYNTNATPRPMERYNTNSNSPQYRSNTRSNGFFDKMRSMVSDEQGTNTSFKVIVIIAIMLIIVFVTIYIVIKLKQGSQKEVNLLKESFLQLDDKAKLPYTISAEKLPASAYGGEYTYNFWIYLADNFETTTQHKLLFFQGKLAEGSTSDSMVLEKGTSPIVAIDKSSNKLLIGVDTTNVAASTSLENIFSSSTKHLTTSIDYLPLQRWINVTICVIDNALRVYLDGDIYSVVSTSELQNKGRITTNNRSNISIGNAKFVIRGHMSKFMYFNHAISQQKIRSIYRNGPSVKGIMSYFGLAHYGLQSPIYRIS